MKVFNFLRCDLNVFGLACFLICMNSSTALDYLKDRPSFLKPCKLKDTENVECFTKSLENIFTKLGHVIPGLGSFDPFNIKVIHAKQNNENINIKFDMQDVVLTGLSKLKVIKGSIDEDFTVKAVYNVPLLNTKAKYRLKGSILQFNFNVSGTLESNAYNIVLLSTLKLKIIKVDDQKFFDITGIKSHIKNLSDFHITSDNAAVSEIFNQNWRDVFEITRPVFEKSLEEITLNRLKAIVHYVPADYLFEGLP